MRLLLLIALLAFIVWIAWQGCRAVAGAMRSRRLRQQPWEIIEESDGEAVTVYAHKHGQQKLLIGYAPFGSYDFDSKLYELRAEGREKVIALNQGKTLEAGS